MGARVRRSRNLIDGIPAVFAAKDDPVWSTVESALRWCESEGIELSPVALLNLEAGPATRYNIAALAWRRISNYSGDWPYRSAGSARERFNKFGDGRK